MSDTLNDTSSCVIKSLPINELICGHAASVMSSWPSESVDIVITSPPYWTAVAYEDQVDTWATYEDYLADIMNVWKECARVLRPNGKLCINSPLMPVPKAIIEQHTRHVKNIAFDFDNLIMRDTDLQRFSVFIWQKQTSKLMFGSYPFPGNILENNTIEFINVYVKPGKPPKFDPEVKEASRLSRSEWLDLTQQIWFMYPEDIRREDGHPAPFPKKLPARLIRLYTFGEFKNFAGEIVVDPFVGTGTTCAVAKSMGRQWIGIDLSERYLASATRAIAAAPAFEPLLIVGRPKYPSREELLQILEEEASSSGPSAIKKHKRQTYGRGADAPSQDELDLG
jgi:DNA modification methylase